jgi:hypothetical protein
MQDDSQYQGRAFRHTNRVAVRVGCLIVSLAATIAAFALCSSANMTAAADIHISGDKAKSPPLLVFACDGATGELEHLFSQPGVISDLQQLHAGISLALPELSTERAALAQKLNQADIPVTAWLALPPEQGYYLNADNARAAEARFSDFDNWTKAYGLHWAGIGLDIEPGIQDFSAFRHDGKWHIVHILLARYFALGRVQHAREAYATLIQQMHARGYSVETYQFPFIADERKVHSTLLERLEGIVDVRGDREALMVYTSFHPALDSAMIWEYGPEAQAIVIGTTVGPENDPHFAPLHWDAFSRDLLVAHHFSSVIGVYNLEGCVRQGFLARLKTMDWEQPVDIPAGAVRQAEALRTRIQRAIWIGSYLSYFAAALLVAALLIVWFIARRPHNQRLRRSV